jgi:hypothetical protein
VSGGASSRVVLRGLPGEVFGALRRHAVVALIPAAILGAGTDVVEVLRHDLGAEIALGVVLAVAFQLYVGYAELLVAADRGEGPRPSVRTLFHRAAAVLPTLLAASIVAVSLPLAATGLLVLPGLWLLTLWGLFAPAVVHERLGTRAALRRSAALVRRAFWPVAIAVTLPVLFEHAVLHATAHTAEPVLGSQVLALIAAALFMTAIVPPVAFTISIVYERLIGAEGAHPLSATPAPRRDPSPVVPMPQR